MGGDILEVQLTCAQIVGEPRVKEDAITKDLPIKSDRGRLLLSKYLKQFDPSTLGFLVSGTADTDIIKQNCAALSRARVVHTRFHDEDKFLSALAQLVEDGTVKGIVVSRGGSEGLGTIGDSLKVARALLETGLPFYVAMGHNTHRLFLDAHADQVFDGPQDFGLTLADFLKEKDRVDEVGVARLRKTIDRLMGEKRQLEETLVRLETGRTHVPGVRAWRIKLHMITKKVIAAFRHVLARGIVVLGLISTLAWTFKR